MPSLHFPFSTAPFNLLKPRHPVLYWLHASYLSLQGQALNAVRAGSDRWHLRPKGHAGHMPAVIGKGAGGWGWRASRSGFGEKQSRLHLKLPKNEEWRKPDLKQYPHLVQSNGPWCSGGSLIHPRGTGAQGVVRCKRCKATGLQPGQGAGTEALCWAGQPECPLCWARSGLRACMTACHKCFIVCLGKSFSLVKEQQGFCSSWA